MLLRVYSHHVSVGVSKAASTPDYSGDLVAVVVALRTAHR